MQPRLTVARNPTRARRSGPASSANRSLVWALAALIWLCIVPSTVAFDGIMRASPGAAAALATDALAPNPVTRVLKLGLIIFGGLVVLAHVGEARALLRRLNTFFLAFLVLALTSITWSADPDATLARYVSYIAIVLAGFAFCLAGWHRKRLQNVVRPVLTLLLLGSLIYILMEPMYALDFDGAGYHGLAEQKNPFGELCAFGTLFWMHAWIAGDAKLWKAVSGAALGWTCLCLSKSATSILGTVFASCLLLMLLRSSPLIRRYTPYLVTLFGCLVVAYALAILQLVPGLATVLLEPITAITGKDMTFSNRAMIWDIIKEHAQLHPLLGTGYGAYWTGAVPTSPSYVFLSRMYFWPSEAHNGYLDVVNDLGFVGLIILLGYLMIYVKQSLQLFRVDRSQGALYLALFFEQAMNNLSESCWFSPMGILPIAIMTLSTCTLARALLDQHHSRAMQGAMSPPNSGKPMLVPRRQTGLRR
jgi:exopolysaccharide production protein ExoQ